MFGKRHALTATKHFKKFSECKQISIFVMTVSYRFVQWLKNEKGQANLGSVMEIID